MTNEDETESRDETPDDLARREMERWQIPGVIGRPGNELPDTSRYVIDHARIETVANARSASAASPTIVAACRASSLVIPLVKRRQAVS
jgi:hypothetical protein